MTVQELIDILSEIKDKSKPVRIDIFDDEVKDVIIYPPILHYC